MTIRKTALINAADSPEGDLVKDVYAHFGLCVYLAQVFETGLINVLTAIETSASKTPTRQTFDVLYAKHQNSDLWQFDECALQAQPVSGRTGGSGSEVEGRTR